jgi:hypothetical protein
MNSTEEQFQNDASLQEIGRVAVMIYRGARVDASRIEAFWATAAALVAFLRGNVEEE